MKEINSKVKEIIVEKLGVDEAEVVSEASFASDFGADSLDTVELIMEFEKEFGISIPDEDVEGIRTVGEAVAYIEKNCNATIPHMNYTGMRQHPIHNCEKNKIKQK